MSRALPRNAGVMRLGSLFLVIRSPRTPHSARDGRPLFRAFGWRVFVGVL